MMDERDVVRNAYLAALEPLDPDAEVKVEQGSADYWHVVAVSRAFESKGSAERDPISRQALRSLGPTLAIRVTVAMLLTPDEYQEYLQPF